ncbi:hypothetical protein SDRG_08807 [Saprolegnia diclina VS20]|uniref:Uncharacterized protein n=1 Tax=Saprolegnia diclina (strain VS20) TaxID=1156394 RepID=T0RMX6_SAPDV|nr:hypothetical protein SDRG_08807 [Saprolegnia diclina VS20]EQC33703.1 hypothetical protein SDRG_08807 [Saprolegnia diclina VS20]|eukprot:XP_008612926.1 hypothetical protein SDRG_08807 [Saprolegnia diclina VS20]
MSTPSSDDPGAFFAAARTGDVSTLAACLVNGSCNPNARTATGWTALHFAVFYGNIPVVRLLAASPRVDVNALSAKGTSPITLALKHQGSHMLEILLRR